MEKIAITTKSKQYDVYLGETAISALSPFIKATLPDCTKVLLLTDETVAPLYLQQVLKELSELAVVSHIVPSGEKAKTFAVYEQCLTFALEQQLDRKSLLVALGGGAVGDLGGFVAATYMRGIPFIQLPTTILAHDSAVGGKVAINHPLGKNMVGAFYQPEAVFYDLSFLRSLPDKEIRSGFSEVIKHALIHEEEFLQQLMEEVISLNELKTATLQSFLKKGIEVKGAIVEADEQELGVRAFLNFGHTLGHAIEGEAGYGVITHGEAVLIGMLFALEVSVEKLGLSFDLATFRNWVAKLGYKTTLDANFSPEKLLVRMQQDKKSYNSKVRFVLLEEIGRPRILPLDDQYLLEKLSEYSQRG